MAGFNFNDYLKYNDDDSVTFTGNTLVVHIPRRYEKYAMISVGDTVRALGIFEINVNETQDHGLFIPAVLDLCPTRSDYVTVNGADYLRCIFNKGDTFIKNKQVVRNEYIAYIIFTEYLESGFIPEFLSYDNCAFIFDTIKEVTGSKIPAKHVVYEAIFSHMAKKPGDYRVPYRLSDMKHRPLWLKLTDIPHTAQSFTAKAIGGYFQDSINTSLVNENDQNSYVEDILRG